MSGADDRPADGPPPGLEDARAALREAREALARAERAVEEAAREGAARPAELRLEGPEWTWRERLWAAPAETRVGVEELAEGLGVSKSWIYQRTKAGAEPRLPHRKLAGSLVFVVGEVRAWIREHEATPLAGPTWSPAGDGLGVVEGGGGAP